MLYEEIASWTGISLEDVRLADGLIDDNLFLTRFNAKQKELIGRFDTRITGPFSLPRRMASYPEDPSTNLLYGQLGSSLHSYLYNELGIQEEWPRYLAFNEEANLLWDIGESPNILPSLRMALVQNPRMRLFAACGYFDLATPFCSVEYSLNKLRLPHVDLTYGYYEGGHMFYADPKALRQFKRDLTRFYHGK